MKTENEQGNPKKEHVSKDGEEDTTGYPLYPPSDDIYNQQLKEPDIDPDDPSRQKAPNEKPGTWNEKNFEQDVSGNDLDIPGAELDDPMERIGTEDEENNHYSIGGDDHSGLEEDKGS